MEMNANAAMSRTPLGQIGEAISFATDPWRARAYAPKYTPTEQWVHNTLSFPRDIPRRVKAMPGQLMDWIDSKILPPNLTKGAGVFTASGNKVQGVGLRKLYHSLLDERGLTGLGVNNEDTGDVELSFDGDEARRKEVFKELAARIRAKTNHPVTFAPTTVPQTSTPVKLSNKDSERLNAIHHLAYRMSNMYDPADPLMDPNDTFKQKLADRFRLQVNKRGLTGTVPSRAAEQLLGTRPMYAGMMPARRTRSEAEALSDMPMEQQQRLFKALKSGRGFLAAAKEKSAAPMNLYSYIPNGSIEHVKKHGLLSGNELAKPENRHLLDIARPDGDADRWLKERDARLAKSPWTNSYNGPSAFFGDIDAEKIHDKHPIKKFDTTRAVIKLRELLRDYPATKMEGSELIPFSDTTYAALDEKGRNEFVNKRHHTLSLDEIKALLTRGQNPKDMWKDFKDTEGKYYASDVPHAQVVTPMGKIPSKYIEFK
jgi:acylphosphatase